jgi:exportin-1
MAAIVAAGEQLLDFSKPFDVNLLDQIVLATYDPHNPNQAQANTVLMALQEHRDMWTRSVEILEKAQQPQTKFFGLQVLENVIQTQWNALPAVSVYDLLLYVCI